jgi:hypothetical protein
MRLLEQARQVGLGFVDVDDRCHRSTPSSEGSVPGAILSD